MAATIDRFKQQEAEAQETRETPEAQQEREASQHAYEGLSSEESEELLVTVFPEALAALNADPSRWLSDAALDRPLGEGAANVTKEGETTLYESTVPVIAENDEGEAEKVSLALEETNEGWVAENPLVEVEIGESAAEGVAVGGEGSPSGGEVAPGAEAVEIAQVGVEEVPARPFGDKNIFFGEVEAGSDTDMMVSPVSGGVEIYDMLRSVDSPEVLRFNVEGPLGSQLRDSAGGAELVAEDGTVLGTIPPPHAVDAQGATVPVGLEVEGDSVVLHVEHREQEVAYPLLVDPLYQDWSGWRYKSNLQGTAAWGWSENQNGWLQHGYEDKELFPGWGGLFVVSKPGALPPNQWGHWVYSAPNENSYLANAILVPFWRNNQGCNPPAYSQPYDYDGMWNGSSWNRIVYNEAWNQGSSELQSWGRALMIGMGTSTEALNPCWRSLAIGGVGIWLDDWGSPWLNSVEAPPTKWLKKDDTVRAIKVVASDEGLGVRNVTMFGLGTPTWPWNHAWCQGTYEHRCPTYESGEIPYTTNGFPKEGAQKYSVKVEDPVEKTWTSQEYTLKVDGLAPTINLSGELATVTAEAGSKENTEQSAGNDNLSMPVYNLKIAAEDASSGLKEVKLYLDGKPLTSQGPTCTGESCPSKYEWTYPFTLTGLTEGTHTLEIGAVDFVGNEVKPESRKIEFKYIPATGMKEEYVLQHFLLPDGQNHSGEEYEGPELAVNVTNGNVVYRERDLQAISQRGRNLELERIYNSQQPAARDGQWGHGWSLAQTPEFKPETGEATSGKMLRTSAVTSAVSLPKTTSEPTFSSRLHATIAKTQVGGYEVRNVAEDETQVFNSGGRIEETRLSNLSPEVTVAPAPAFPAYAESLGSSGSGNGQLSHPADAVKDASGNLWVVDKANNRIVEFNEAGEFVRSAGSKGSGAGQLNSPSGIALDSFGVLDVTDTGNNRVVRFNDKGEFSSAVGANVNKTKVEAGGTLAEKNRCTAASGNVCQAGTTGTAEGLMAEPIGITTSSGGNFFVVEKGNNRVEKFNTNGELLAKFGSAGSEPGKLKEPTAIASSPAGNGYFWVADTGNNRIEEWTSSFSFVRAVGGEGSGNGQFKSPSAIEADSQGNVWVGDQGNQRVQELSPSGDYITQFGGPDQFGFSAPMGIYLDSSGGLWVTDSGTDQVQEWLTGSFLFAGSRIGSNGTGNGQFSHPADVALDGKGNLWVLDRGNNRLEKFNEKGEYVTALGSKGGAAGQLNAPSALAIDPSGNLWIADTANNRVVEFNEAGQFVLAFGREVNKTKVETAGATEAEKNLCTAASGNVCQAGVVGSTNGQLKTPQGIAATSGGNLWVADTGNNRLKKFGPTGSLLNNIAGEGTEAGKVKEPTAVAMGPDGSIWVADAGNNRIEQWNSSLAFVRQFGSEGTGNGQFKRPAALEVDSAGNVWVGDQNNQRIQQFTSTGEYVAQLGSSSEFAFSVPMGVAADNKGGLWVTDTDHNRVQRILTSKFAKPVATQVPAIDYSYSGTALSAMELEEPEAPDPAITVATTSGLATSASSSSDTATYSYASGKLTAAKDASGEAKFEYEAGNRIKKVTLPNGTWATIAYDSVGRATEVTVKPAGGTEKTTKFAYQTEPHRTTVWGGGNPEVIYYIGEDGSVFEWKNAVTAPTIEGQGGSLWARRNEPKELDNKTHTLFVTGYSQNEISSVKLVTGGNAVVAEETCEDTASPPDHHCDQVTLEYITSAAAHLAGRQDFEVVVTDSLKPAHSTAERFFVTWPQQPPPDPEAPEIPSYESIKQFREEYGLDRNQKLTRPELNELILRLLYEFERRDPVAVKAVDSWGVPMQEAELAEMEWRREYINRAGEVIPEWAEEHASSTFGGFYVDDRAGGIIYVGFTENQHALVEALKGDSRLLNASAIREYPTPPSNSVATLRATAPTVGAALAGEPSLAQQVVSVGVPPEGNVVRVGATETAQIETFLQAHFGTGAPISVVAEEPSFFDNASRFAHSGPLVAGSALIGAGAESCTAGFGARAPSGLNNQGKTQYKYFALTAGHCYFMNEAVGWQKEKFGPGIFVGYVKRSAYSGTVATDGEGVWLEDEGLRSHSVLNGSPLEAQPIQDVQKPRQHVCWSGVYGGDECGRVLYATEAFFGGHLKIVYVVKGVTISGDSGGPVWDPETHKAVGLITGGSKEAGGRCWPTSYQGVAHQGRICSRMVFTPLLAAGGSEGIVPKLGVEVLTQGQS